MLQRANLHKYQITAVNHIENNPCAALFLDMGLGKTVQTIAVLASRAAQGPQLVVVPASVLLNWRDELTRFAPSLKQVILNLAGDRADVLKKAKAGTVVVTTYGILTSEQRRGRPRFLTKRTTLRTKKRNPLRRRPK